MAMQLPLMELYYTIQGEGFHQGRAAVFIRLAGCDVGCIWCDVKESWTTEGYPVVKIEEIVSRADAHNSEIVVITGGEPLMYDLTNLTQKLNQVGLATHLETSGAYIVTGDWDWICFSPKKFKQPIPEVAKMANELKIIVYNDSDFKWAVTYAGMVNNSCKLYLQPEWGKAQKIMPKIIQFVKENPKWKISLQIHKYMEIP